MRPDMLSNPVFSKLDAAIIALLALCGAAIMIEAHHRILIVAPETGTDSNVDRPDEPIFAPATPTTAPAEAPRLGTEE
jgi:hypothetical protein